MTQQLVENPRAYLFVYSMPYICSMLITSTIFAESAIVETLFLFKYFKIRFLHINCYHRQWCLSSFKNLNRNASDKIQRDI